MNQETISIAKNLIAMGKVTRESENFWKVDDSIVIRVVKPGRTRLDCDCSNFSRFNIEKPLCQHQIAVILYESHGKFYKTIDAVIKKYEGFKNIKVPLTEPLDAFIEELKLLKYVK